jgi:hypothetical protein
MIAAQSSIININTINNTKYVITSANDAALHTAHLTPAIRAGAFFDSVLCIISICKKYVINMLVWVMK